MVRRKNNRQDVFIMSTKTIILACTQFTTSETEFYFTCNLEGPPGEWFQLWYRTLQQDQKFVDFVGWIEQSQGNFDSNGTSSRMINFNRVEYEGQKGQLMAIGENDVFSNLLDFGPLIAPEEAPPEPVVLPYPCPYCNKRFATVEELEAHITSEHARDIVLSGGSANAAAYIDALKSYDYVDAISKYTKISGEEIQISPKPSDIKGFSKEELGTGRTIQEIYSACRIGALEAETKYNTMVSAAVIQEAVPFVDTGNTSLGYMNAPKWSAGNKMATDFYYSSFRYATDPMLQRYWFKKETPLIPESYRLALAASKGILTDKEYFDGMAQNGLNAKWADMYRMQNYTQPSFGQLAELYWRGLLDNEMFDMLMHLNGQHPSMDQTMRELLKLIPPAQDLITMVVRESFVPEMVTKAPDVFAEYMAKKGFDKTWSDRYWTMHWQPMPLRQAYENYWRGNWTKDQLENLLKIADFHPMWRQGIIDVAYMPPGIREMGYGYDFGRYTRDDIIRYRRWGGLSPEDAEKAADALIDYRTNAEWEALRREILWAFAHEEMSEEEFRLTLEGTGLQPNIIDLWVSRGLWQQERYKVPETAIEYRIVTSSEAIWAFKNNLRDKDWLRKTLYALNWEDARVNLAVERAVYEKTLKEGQTDIVAPKSLSAAQLKSLYDAKLISNEVLAYRLHTELNYSVEDAMLLAELWFEPEVAPVTVVTPHKLTLAQLSNLYEVGLIDTETLIVRLHEELNYTVEDAVMLIALMPRPIEMAPATPTETTTYAKPYTDAWARRLYAQRILLPEQVYTNYVALGYDPKQAEKLTISMLIDDVYPTLTAQYMKGLIDEQQFMQVLVDIGMYEWQALDLLDRTVRDYQTSRLDDERKLTKAEIIKGYKNQILTIDNAANLLMDIGYEYWEAQYILTLENVIAAGDPETYWDMKKVTEAYKRALNRENKPVSDEVLMLDRQIKRLKAELEELKKTNADEKKVAQKIGEIADYEARLRKVLALTRSQ